MKIYIKLLTTLAISLSSLTCSAQKELFNPSEKVQSIVGVYQKIDDSEILMMNSDSTFYSLRNMSIHHSDLIVPLCDTLANGYWKKHNGFIELRNYSISNDIDYTIIETEYKSKDSLYFQIILPEEDAVNSTKFLYSITTSPLFGTQMKTEKSRFVIFAPKARYSTFNLSIQNISPNCDYNTKCYQKIYFKVFENYRPKNAYSNCFKIILTKFNQCFYEAFDLNGEIIGIEGETLYWRGNLYKKLN
ncbi:MAG TPA: hypothetical protein PKY29_07970 [Ferruginibacter sp.]|nr:hypothetical protein [Ferruginibacter sp.]HRO17329.1 hypothetical protein [Ferruginibacter sp.]HRQ21236.1 hypothetical protein [Ferruginibacter sp.]